MIRFLILFFPMLAFGATDYKCVSDCSNNGYTYQYCSAICTYDTSQSLQLQPVQPQQLLIPSGTDYRCLNECTSNGYMYQYCKQRCSY